MAAAPTFLRQYVLATAVPHRFVVRSIEYLAAQPRSRSLCVVSHFIFLNRKEIRQQNKTRPTAALFKYHSGNSDDPLIH